jgi:hypothetical protein
VDVDKCRKAIADEGAMGERIRQLRTKKSKLGVLR